MSAGLREALSAALRGRVVILGIGNPMRGDDAVGCRIARSLLAAGGLRDGVAVIDAEEVPESHLGPVVAARPDVILLVDASDLGAEPGAAALLDAAALDARVVATHRTPLAPIARYLRAETGADIRLLAVQPGPLRWNDALSEPVDSAARWLTTLLLDALAVPEGSAA